MIGVDVVVVGGGIAGIAAALRMADAGRRVVLLEASRRLGGRATSHTDPATGEEIDNCQHVTMGACTAYNAMIRRLGRDGDIAWTDTQTWLEAGGACSTISPRWLPAPLHYARSFAAARFLTPLDKAAIAAAIPRVAAARRQAWEARTFLDFLHDAAQPEGTIRRFWSPVVVSACNLDVDRISAAPALMVFQTGLLAGPRAARIGVPRVPLGRLYEGAGQIISGAGGSIVLGARAASVMTRGRGVRITLAGAGAAGSEIEAAAAVIATPPARVAGLLPPDLAAVVPALAALEHSPILGVHLRASRPILSAPHAVLIDRTTHWLFRRDDSGSSLHAVISAAPARLVAMPEPEIVDLVWRDVTACIPAARDAAPTWSRVIKSRQATFAATPAFESLRPPPGPIRPGCPIALAGDYTRTGWPATMEGAARSGAMAADALLASLA